MRCTLKPCLPSDVRMAAAPVRGRTILGTASIATRPPVAGAAAPGAPAAERGRRARPGGPMQRVPVVSASACPAHVEC